MEKEFSIIYAHRNRDISRIKVSLNSLQKQETQNFEVHFVDYGSEEGLIWELEKLFSNYPFLIFHKLEVSQLLWNKSKALNFGIQKAVQPFVFIADVDLIFHPGVTKLFEGYAKEKNFFLFKMGYLEKEESRKLMHGESFERLTASRTGKVNGMIMAPTEAFLDINGFDEFFHFYGAEDEDLFARMENAGYTKNEVDNLYFYHNWHPSFSAADDENLTSTPRVQNIMRINQQHFFRNRERGVTKPLRQKGMGTIIEKEESNLLNHPSIYYEVANIRAKVEHFLGEELPRLIGEIVSVEFQEDPYYPTLKHKLKRILGKESQQYCSLKEINDMLLKEILFRYRDHNYSFKVSEDLKSIKFIIKL